MCLHKMYNTVIYSVCVGCFSSGTAERILSGTVANIVAYIDLILFSFVAVQCTHIPHDVK